MTTELNLKDEREQFDDEVMRILTRGDRPLPFSAFDGWLMAKRSILDAVSATDHGDKK